MHAYNPVNISFYATFGPYPRLVLTYLRSYVGLGNAEMWFSSSPGKKVALHRLYASMEPQPDTINFSVSTPDHEYSV